MTKDLDFTENPVGSLNSMMTDHKNIRERAADALRQHFGTDLVAIEWMRCWMTLCEVTDVDVMAYIGNDIRPHPFTLSWDKTTEQFAVDEDVDKNLAKIFQSELRRFKIDSKSKQDLFILLVKANRRRKSTERKAYKLRDKIRRINDDAMTAIGSRQRTIEDQWEVMRELQRRGLVTADALEQVLWDVMKIKRPINEH